MGRKKKIKIEEKKFNGIGYKGTVTVKIGNKKSILSSTTINNSGLIPLFQFLCKCLRGDYSEVELLRPKFIRIFSLGRGTSSTNPSSANADVVPEGSFADLASTYPEISLTTPLYSGNPNINLNTSSNEASISFHFVIPFTQLSQYDNLNMIALYSQQNRSNKEQASAYIIVKNKTNSDYLGDIVEESGININDDNSNEYNLFIEWELSFSNYKDE